MEDEARQQNIAKKLKDFPGKMNENRINKFVVKSTDYITQTIRIILFQNCAYVGNTRINKFVVSFPGSDKGSITGKWKQLIQKNIQTRLDIYFRDFYDNIHQMKTDIFFLRSQYIEEYRENVVKKAGIFIRKYDIVLSDKSFGHIGKIFQNTDYYLSLADKREKMGDHTLKQIDISKSQ